MARLGVPGIGRVGWHGGRPHHTGRVLKCRRSRAGSVRRVMREINLVKFCSQHVAEFQRQNLRCAAGPRIIQPQGMSPEPEFSHFSERTNGRDSEGITSSEMVGAKIRAGRNCRASWSRFVAPDSLPRRSSPLPVRRFFAAAHFRQQDWLKESSSRDQSCLLPPLREQAESVDDRRFRRSFLGPPQLRVSAAGTHDLHAGTCLSPPGGFSIRVFRPLPL